MGPLKTNAEVSRVRELLQGARSVFVLTGAGASAESGIPTFRGADGWWKKFRAEELATPQAFSENPKLVWEWYDHRRRLVAEALPNDGHRALAKIEGRAERFLLATQNVDDLHERAGSRNVEHVHGSLWRVRCTSCSHAGELRDTPLPETPPRCKACRGLLRPDIVWFGETLNPAVVQRIGDFLQKLSTRDAALVVGTTAVFGYIQQWALMAKQSGAAVIEINPQETPLTQAADYALRAKSAEVLPQIVDG